jgi:hypothetical protein
MILLPPPPPVRDHEPTHLVKATGAIEIRPKDGGDLSLAARRLFSHLLAHAYPRLRDAWPKAREAADQARRQMRDASNLPEQQEQAARRAMLRVLSDVAEHQVSAVQIRRFAAEARQGTEDVNNTRLRDALQKLQTLLVEFNYLQSDGTVWESMTLLGPSRIARDGTLTYTFHPALLEKLIG